MTRKIDIDRMRVASPCHVGWDSMTGDDRARHCESCDRHVYNIVGLTRPEIESLVENTEGRLCVRMYQRPDATVLTEDCPVGLRLIRKRVTTFAGAALSALLSLVSVGYGQKPEDCFYSGTKLVERVKIDSYRGQISGQIFDPNGAVVPGIKLRLHLDKRRISTVASDASGSFSFSDIKPANGYTIRIDEQQGWKKQLIDGITVIASEKIIYGICIQVSNVYEVVGSYGQPTLIKLEGTEPSSDLFRRKP